MDSTLPKTVMTVTITRALPSEERLRLSDLIIALECGAHEGPVRWPDGTVITSSHDFID